ncbi:MAG: hypothetical protein A2X05_04675 [Bacteroidetes bacterium GWE2_41_25]|nr:MAG: hypothetical protein A2X03_18250 [Bacteroidetes bacterium GWA2_40_15]OFX92251.1 MAG: hypothetical protein A2X06_07055 [Bacteroidetes bacterium GWC2_40_22]OFY02060.1 MAG: hypothetical protein A2X05_04675 [Bacteroidetes bacterium GWE2_41_25]OFY61929.1 MAG: hypothetical protein A2X04_11340 [Bacteroidetes bacterium GWF2_41_9]HAM09072.1 hypothetical protein [Bacteroidales bacterium]
MRSLIQISLVLIILNSTFISVSGQNVRQEAPPLRERMFFGGSFGLQFGTLTNIQVSPIVGLWVLPRLAVAAGPTFTYYKYYEDETTMCGGKGYAQFVILKDLNNILPVGIHTGIFVHLEDELLNLESAYWQNPPYASDRFTVNTVLLGGGLSQQLGRRSFMNIMVLWALQNSGYAIYDNPEIRISFNF